MSRSNHSRAEKKQKPISSHLEKIHLLAAGIDIGSETHFVAVPEKLDDKPVRTFPALQQILKPWRTGW